MMLLRDIGFKRLLQEEMKDVVLAVIPFYNVGGAINRNSTSRTNQNGPKSYGFRGNGRNYDLNRDFIKSDTKNAESFAKIFHYLDPDLFLDTHVSNGADYQYTMTLVYPQKDKLGGVLKDFQEETLLPYLFSHMEKGEDIMTPYVNMWGSHHRHPTPDKGIEQFPDYPRYSTGYTALFHTIGFMTETHMLKPYNQRVRSTLTFMKGMITACHLFKDQLLQKRQNAKAEVKKQSYFPVSWVVDPDKHKDIEFLGYESGYKKSGIHNQDRLYYDRSKPIQKTIPFYDSYKTKDQVMKPEYYFIPRSWHNIIHRLDLNNITYTSVDTEQEFEATVYYIQDFETSKSPYEGHYIHYNIQLEERKEKIKARKGDIMVPVNQAGNRYIIETLEPLGEDSFFKWNFFDMILQRKEYFSSYVFEDLALEILRHDPALQEALDKKIMEDETFANNPNAQLYFIYQHSEHAEKAYMRYPIFKIE
ncbi:MAG: hypothetical protein HKN67_07705, partial [Saprospiraceae bacterium]|nr:hypothetical protein [Saprospiraceae bacterium]